MKNYQKPNLDINALQIKEPISNLATWLASNQEYKDAAITTYVIES